MKRLHHGGQMAQDGSLYAIGNTCYLKYYTVIDGKRVHKTVELCKRSDTYDWWKKKRNGKTRWSFSNAVTELQRQTMDKIKADAKAVEVAARALAQGPTPGETSVRTFWETRFLPYCEDTIA